MPTVTTINGDLSVTGSISCVGLSGATRASLTQETSQVYPVELMNFRIWDAFQTLITTAGTDDLGITAAAFGTGTPYIHSGDLNAAGSITRYARSMFTLPPEYVAGGAVTIRFSAGMLTAVASVAATVDVEAYKSDRDTTIGGSDLVTTSATSINSTTHANYSFTVTPSGLAPGDVLDLRIALICNSATASSHFATISNVEVLLTVKG